jgi:hypothetical protein
VDAPQLGAAGRPGGEGPSDRFAALPTSPSQALSRLGPSLSPLKGGEGHFLECRPGNFGTSGCAGGDAATKVDFRRALRGTGNDVELSSGNYSGRTDIAAGTQDHVGALFGDHDGGSVGIAGNHRRHDRGIDDP